MHSNIRILLATMIISFLHLSAATASPQDFKVSWNKVVRVSKTSPTLQVVVNPLLRRDSPIHDQVFKSLRDLSEDYVRYVPWLPYPKLGVAELEPPTATKTSWDFSLIDPMTEDFFQATAGHSVILNFSTIPQWMFKTDKPVTYPADPDQVNWDYEQGTELRDSAGNEVADYFARLVGWYTAGGFRDERGQWHASGHHFQIPYWEVLNEVDSEHRMSPETYTRLYDATVQAIHSVSPDTKFVGLALASPSGDPEYFDYFLNPKNHRPGTPLDMISYHFYASPSADESPESWPYTFFDQADGFLNVVGYVEAIRNRLSPETRTDVDELGAILPFDTEPHLIRPIPGFYWNLCAAMYAYLYVNLARKGIDVVGESQLVGYPTQFPSVSMVDWQTGAPNARYWVLKLLHDNFGPGDRLVETSGTASSVEVQGFVTRDGKRKILLINKRNLPAQLALPGAGGSHEEYVNQETGFRGIGEATLVGDQMALSALEVAVITLDQSSK